MAASKQASIHTHMRNAVLLVWDSLRLAPIMAPPPVYLLHTANVVRSPKFSPQYLHTESNQLLESGEDCVHLLTSYKLHIPFHSCSVLATWQPPNPSMRDLMW